MCALSSTGPIFPIASTFFRENVILTIPSLLKASGCTGARNAKYTLFYNPNVFILIAATLYTCLCRSLLQRESVTKYSEGFFFYHNSEKKC